MSSNPSDAVSHSLSYDLDNTNAYNPNSNSNSTNYETATADTNAVPGNRVTGECISYIPSSLELLIPSPIVISTLCVSTDKTSLFIVSLIRLLLFVILYYILSEIMDLNEHRTLQYIILVIIAVNIMYIGLVVSKSTVFSMGASRSMFELTEFKKTGVNAKPPPSS